RLVPRLGEIKHHGFLAAVEPDEIGALAVDDIIIAARKIAFRPLDLDDACTCVGEPARTHRRRHRLLERNDEEAGEGEGHGGIHAGEGWTSWSCDLTVISRLATISRLSTISRPSTISRLSSPGLTGRPSNPLPRIRRGGRGLVVPRLVRVSTRGCGGSS